MVSCLRPYRGLLLIHVNSMILGSGGCIVGFFPVSFAVRAYKHHLPDYYLFSFSSWNSHLVSYEPFLFAVFILSRCERTETTEEIMTDKERNCRTNPEEQVGQCRLNLLVV